MEAILFLAREPLHARRLARYASLQDGTEARTLVARLNAIYEHEQRAFRVVEVGGGWQLRTRKHFASWVRRLQHIPQDVRLSQPSLETLSVIAYQQPVARTEVDAIRGVHCGEVIRQLMDRDLVRVMGRSEDLGRPYLYGTTKRFLAVFGLRDLSDLPRADLFRRSLERTPAFDPTSNIETGDGDSAVTVTKRIEDLEMEHRYPLLQAPFPAAPIVRDGDEVDEWEEEEEEEEEEDDEDWDDDDDDDDDDEEWEDEEEDELESEEVEDVEEEEEEEEEWEDEDDEEWEEVDGEFEEEDEEDDDEEWDDDEEDDEEWDEDDEE